jgi:hypothetical protein
MRSALPHHPPPASMLSATRPSFASRPSTAPSSRARPIVKAMATQSFHDLSAKDIDGATQQLVCARGPARSPPCQPLPTAPATSPGNHPLPPLRCAAGNAVDFGSFKGKVLLITNVACYCGLTSSGYSVSAPARRSLRAAGRAARCTIAPRTSSTLPTHPAPPHPR